MCACVRAEGSRDKIHLSLSAAFSLFDSPGARTKKWLSLGVNLTHFVESRDLFFLEAEIVDTNKKL